MPKLLLLICLTALTNTLSVDEIPVAYRVQHCPRNDPDLILRPEIPNFSFLRTPATKRERSSEIGHLKAVYAIVKAYTPWDKCDANSGYQDGLTSTLKDTSRFPYHWGIAVDPTVIPYGTEIYVPGYDPSKYYPEKTYWPADDTGSMLRRMGRNGCTVVLNDGTRRHFPPGTIVIELRFIHGSSARRWGTRYMKIYIKDNSNH